MSKDSNNTEKKLFKLTCIVADSFYKKKQYDNAIKNYEKAVLNADEIIKSINSSNKKTASTAINRTL